MDLALLGSSCQINKTSPGCSLRLRTNFWSGDSSVGFDWEDWIESNPRPVKALQALVESAVDTVIWHVSALSAWYSTSQANPQQLQANSTSCSVRCCTASFGPPTKDGKLYCVDREDWKCNPFTACNRGGKKSNSVYSTSGCHWTCDLVWLQLPEYASIKFWKAPGDSLPNSASNDNAKDGNDAAEPAS